MQKKFPIGVFDSGVGGISVLKEIYARLPHEDYIYFGDTKNSPYGTKSEEEILTLAHEVFKKLLAQHCKIIVIACNTITSVAINFLRSTYPEISIVGTEPAVKPAIILHAKNKNGHACVMATPATISNHRFLELVHRFEKDYDEKVLLRPCEGLMDFVERGELYSENLKNYLREKTKDFAQHNIQSVALGCTHYPFIEKALREVISPEIFLVHGGEGIARQTEKVLTEKNLLSDDVSHQGKIFWQSSFDDDPRDTEQAQKYRDFCETLFHS